MHRARCRTLHHPLVRRRPGRPQRNGALRHPDLAGRNIKLHGSGHHYADRGNCGAGIPEALAHGTTRATRPARAPRRSQPAGRPMGRPHSQPSSSSHALPGGLTCPFPNPVRRPRPPGGPPAHFPTQNVVPRPPRRPHAPISQPSSSSRALPASHTFPQPDSVPVPAAGARRDAGAPSPGVPAPARPTNRVEMGDPAPAPDRPTNRVGKWDEPAARTGPGPCNVTARSGFSSGASARAAT